MEATEAMERIAALNNNNASGIRELIEVVSQEGVSRTSSAPLDDKSSPERKSSPTGQENSLIIEIDPSFFEKEILESKEDNYLRLLTDQFHTTQNQIKKVRENILQGDNYIVKNKLAIDDEISRGTTYKFDEIEGDVTQESFQKGLIKVGVNKENQKVLDFLMLFNLQGFGAVSFGVFSSTISLFNNLLKQTGTNPLNEKGTLLGEIDRHQFKQKLRDNVVTTEVIENISIKFASYYDASKINVGEFKVVAEIDNNTLNCKFKSIRVTFWDKNCILLIEKYLKSIGFQRIKKVYVNDKQLIKTTTSQNNEQNNYDELNCTPDYQLFPYTLSEQNELKKDPTKMMASGNQLVPEYSGNNLDLDATKNVKVELPQTRLARQATLLLSSKRILEAVQQSIQESLKSPTKKNVGDEELLREIGKAINILEDIDRDIRALNSNEFDIKISRNFHLLTQIRSNICKFSNNDYAVLVGVHIGKSSNKMTNEIVLMHLDIVLNAFKSSESFITSLQHYAIEQFIILITECKKLKQTFSNNQQIVKGNGCIKQFDEAMLNENKIEDIMTALHHDFINAFEYLKFDSSEDKILSNSSDFVLFSLQIKCTIAEITQKKSVCYLKIKELKKDIDNVKLRKRSSVSKANLTHQLECYKKIFNCYTETIKILQNVLGEINCHFYTQDVEKKGLHPRNIFSGKNTPDPLNESVDYKQYLTYQAKKLFDGSAQQFSFFDYILPWRWNNYRKKLIKNTYYHLNLSFNDNNKTPRQKLIIMKHIIEENRPSRLNIFRRSERKKYDELKNHTYQLCLLDAFGQGYLTPTELSDELLKYIHKKKPSNQSQIKAYAGELRAKCKEFEIMTNQDKMKELSQKLAHFKFSSSAKAHAILSKQHKGYIDLSDQVKREIDCSSSSVSNSSNASSLSSSSDSLDKLKMIEESNLNGLATVSPGAAITTLKMSNG